MTPTEAKEILEADNQRRAQECLDAINKILKDFNCKMAVAPDITINGEKVSIAIIPN